MAKVNIVLTMNITHWLALLTIHLTLNHMTLTNESYEMSQLNTATFKLDQIAWPSFSGWWFQPLWKILVSWGYYSQYMGK